MYDNMAGDIATADGGVGGIGDASVFFNSWCFGDHLTLFSWCPPGITSCGSAFLASLDDVLDVTIGPFDFLFFGALIDSISGSLSSDTPYRSSNSVTSVMALCLFQELVRDDDEP